MAVVVIIKIYRDLDPIERYERYHKPLDVALKRACLGQVIGGGTMLDLDTDEAIYSDLQVEIDGDLDLALGLLRAELLSIGVAPGTQLCVEGTDLVVNLATH